MNLQSLLYLPELVCKRLIWLVKLAARECVTQLNGSATNYCYTLGQNQLELQYTISGYIISTSAGYLN